MGSRATLISRNQRGMDGRGQGSRAREQTTRPRAGLQVFTLAVPQLCQVEHRLEAAGAIRTEPSKSQSFKIRLALCFVHPIYKYH